MAKPANPELIRQVLRDIEGGSSLKSVAKKHAISLVYVQKIRQREVIFRLRTGIPEAEISEKLRISRAHIARYKEENLSLNPDSTGSGAVVAARLSQNELDAFDDLVAEMGFSSRGNAIRKMVRLSTDAYSPDVKLLAEFEELNTQLRGLLANVNQIAWATNKNKKLKLSKEDQELLRAVKSELVPFRALLKLAIQGAHRQQFDLREVAA